MEEFVARLQEWCADYGLRVVGAIVILLIGLWIAKAVRNLVKRLLEKAKADPTLVSFLGHLAHIALVTFVVLAVLGKLGVQTASFVAVLGAAAFAVGLALSGSLANFASGVLLLIFRPFKVEDFVEVGGVTGKVEEIQIFCTKLATPDNKEVIIPNAKVTGDNITNYTAKGTRRVDMVIGVSYDADLKKVRDVLSGLLAEDERVLKDPPPTIAVLELADSSVNFAVRPWTSAAEYWNVFFDTMEAAKTRFDAEGIGIPFPQRDVHLYKQDS